MSDKLFWCCKQKRCIYLVALTVNLANDYIESANRNLLTMNNTAGGVDKYAKN